MKHKFYCFSLGEYIDFNAQTKPEVIARLLDERRQRGTSEGELSLWYDWFWGSPWRQTRFFEDRRGNKMP